jgi:hypothetical protein
MQVGEQAGCPDACGASWASRRTTAIGCGLFHGRRKDYAREDGTQPETPGVAPLIVPFGVMVRSVLRRVQGHETRPIRA